MRYRGTFAVHGLIAVLSLVPQATAAPAATQPSVDDLVRAVIESEQWVHKIDSFYVKFDGVWTKTPQAIKRGKAQRRKEFPDDPLDPRRWPEFNPRNTETLEIAFDGRRFYKHENQPTSHESVVFWDGARLMYHEKYFSHPQEQFGIRPEPSRSGQYLFGALSWLRADEDGHSFWWNPRPPGHHGYRFDPDGDWIWTLVGREKYHGIDCWVLEREFGWTRWYVGVERPLLHGLITFVSSNADEDGPKVAAAAAARQLNAPGGDSPDAFFKWKKALPKEQRIAAEAAYARERLKRAHPLAEHMLLDYKEVAPGCWFPMSQGYDLQDATGGPPIVSGSRRLTAVAIKVNDPLPDELFKMEFAEGVEVYDGTHDPPLFYKYKKHFTDAEWQAIVDKAKKDRERWAKQKAQQDAVVGKPAPAFPEKAQWLNRTAAEGPLSWEKLKGKPVVVDFFADWCGPCRNDLPTTASLWHDREKLPFAIVGIHPPGSDPKRVEKLIKEFELNYPICVDVPHEGAWGELFAAYRVNAIPHAVVVDATGKVAGQGSLGEMIAKAKELAAGAGK
jgi:thiol-disulfide isomerase/thioredoxin